MAGTIVFDSAQPDGHSFSVLSNTGTTLLTANTNAIVCTTAGTERMRIDSVGNIFANTSALYVPTHASTANIDFKVGASLNTSFRIESTGQLYNSVESTVGTDYRSTLYPGTLCRAWINFDGTLSGTITPNASFNITNVTKTATGTYTINFTTAMPDANYALAGSSKGPLDDSQGVQPANVTTPFTTTNAQIYSLQNLGTASGGSPYDSPIISAIFFR